MSFLPKWAALAAALASIALVLGPGSASANVASEVQGAKLTVKGDGQNDVIALAVVSGKLAVNGTATTLAANDEAEIVVESGGGNDTVNATALAATDYKALVVNGGEGEDSITGGADSDTLNGDAGNDNLVGFKGNDIVSGGEGDDLMVWSNGDGNDTNNGDAGTDESVFNGATVAPNNVDAIDVTPQAAPNNDRVLLKRTTPTEIKIDIKAEKVTVNGLGGDDKLAGAVGLGNTTPPLTALTLSGGEGNDELTGGDGADTLNGDAGNDLLVGGKGKDTANGGTGNDVMVWNNGDASDVDNGEAGDDEAVVNGSPAAGDVDTYKPVNPADNANVRVLFSRTNLVPFTVDLEAERLTVNGLGGDDTMTPDAASATGLAPRMTLTLDGGEGNDAIAGGDGNDAIAGGAGSDVLDGQAGDDQLIARDKDNDLVRGGAGNDTAQTDELTVDSVNGVEHIDAIQPPAPDRVAQLPRLGKTTVAGKGNSLTARVPVSCPATEKGGCRTRLTLETAKPARVGGLRAVVVLGSKSVRLAAGARTNVAIRIARGAGVLAHRGKLPAKIRIASSDAAGNTATRTIAVALKISH